MQVDLFASLDSADIVCSDLSDIPDETLVVRAMQGDEVVMNYLLQKYRGFVHARAKQYFIRGGDRDDLIQEGMIGLYKAIRDYRSGKLSSFRSFMILCVTRQIITAIKTATRQKHIALNFSDSLDRPIYDDDGDMTLGDIIAGDETQDPVAQIIKNEQASDIKFEIENRLSNMEKIVLGKYLEGKSYVEIARELRRGTKSIDNALQRIKFKIQYALENEERGLDFIRSKR